MYVGVVIRFVGIVSGCVVSVQIRQIFFSFFLLRPLGMWVWSLGMWVWSLGLWVLLVGVL